MSSANDCFWNRFFHLDCPFNNLHFWLKLIHLLCFEYLNYNFPCLYCLHYYWYCYNQKQSSAAVLQKRRSYKFCKIHKKTPNKTFWYRCSLVNSVKFLIKSFSKNSLDACFTINTRSLYWPTMTFHLLKKKFTHIFCWLVFRLNLLVGNNSELNISSH